MLHTCSSSPYRLVIVGDRNVTHKIKCTYRYRISSNPDGGADLSRRLTQQKKSEETSNGSGGKRTLRLSKMPGLIRVRWSRERSSERSSCTVTKNAAGQYHVCLVCKEDVETLPRVSGEGGDLEPVGADLGTESLVTLSTGEKVGNPRWFENEYERQRKRVAKVHQRCSECGHVGGKKPLSVRDWTCSECGTHHDRDINAAKNLSRGGQTRTEAIASKAPGDPRRV